MRAFLLKLLFWQPDQFVSSARRAIFAAGEVRDFDNGSCVVSHAKRQR